jgi:hypothetical protein
MRFKRDFAALPLHVIPIEAILPGIVALKLR